MISPSRAPATVTCALWSRWRSSRPRIGTRTCARRRKKHAGVRCQGHSIGALCPEMCTTDDGAHAHARAPCARAMLSQLCLHVYDASRRLADSSRGTLYRLRATSIPPSDARSILQTYVCARAETGDTRGRCDPRRRSGRPPAGAPSRSPSPAPVTEPRHAPSLSSSASSLTLAIALQAPNVTLQAPPARRLTINC